MSRAFWSGSVRFGLLDIPVTMHAASQPADLAFELVDARDFSPIGYRKINKNTRREVPPDRIVRVFQIDRGEAVVVTEADLRRVRPRALKTLDIAGFLDPADIPVSYFETPYYLEPGREDAHAYVLLREALRRSRKAALGRVVLRTREHLGAVLPEGEFLVFNTLRFPQELRRPKVPQTLAHARPASSEELMMAERLIREMEAPWSPESYHDRYREELLDYVRKKAEAGEARRVYEPEPETEPVTEPPGRDLTDLLRRSLDEGEGPRGERKRRSAS
jgi:DNA end-binding protein Ku